MAGDLDVDAELWASPRDDELVASLDDSDGEQTTLSRLLTNASLDPEVRARVAVAQAEYRDLRNGFASRNLGLVVIIARRIGSQHLALPDRVQEGNIGLLKAIDRFDTTRETRFSTYACWWIRHMITRALMNSGRTVRVPAHLHVVFSKLRRERPSLRARLGREPSNSEIAHHLGVPTKRVDAAIEAMEARRIALQVDGDGLSVGETISDPASKRWTERLELGFDTPRALDALDTLGPRELRILRNRFELDDETPRKTLRALGEDLGVSRERVRQLEGRGLQQLRTALHIPL